MSGFLDGLKDFMSGLVGQRDVTKTNGFEVRRLTDYEQRAIYLTGLGSKIVRIKAGSALKDTLQFNSTDDEEFYNRRLARHVKQAARWMIAFGRGIVVLHHRGELLSEPLREVDPDRVMLSVFSGDMVTVGNHDNDLQSPRYYMPLVYHVRGEAIHYSRVVDFTYVDPPEWEKPWYRYGGVGEFNLIYEQLVADGIVQQASPNIIRKASTLFYKVKGFKAAMQANKHHDMASYFSRLEDIRGIFSAGLIDGEDELEVVTQNLANLSDADQITLRRLAMVTGISVSRLIGENVKGLNSSGDNETQMDQDMVETLQSDYLIEPINKLMRLFGRDEAQFKENQGETPNDRMDYETKAITNALNLWQMGEDHTGYLRDKDIVDRDEFAGVFTDEAFRDGEA